MPENKIVIVGAGLAGSLLAVKLARKGLEVEVYEKRGDMRRMEMSAGRSINLALSNRGIRALNSIGMGEYILREAVQMPGRLIHDLEGKTNFQPYSGRENEYINSISRGGLNIALMDQAEQSGVPIHFNQQCTGMDFQTGQIGFIDSDSGREYTVSSEVVFATDGAGSAIRRAMDQHLEGTFRSDRNKLDHGYKELHIPPAESGGFRMEKNALHIWPRGGFMLIALPNIDGSFTVTLFLAYEGLHSFANLQTPADVRRFFEEQFPDAVPLMPTLEEDFFSNPTGSLATIKCFPWEVNGRSLLIGDAAHAVVPFYGQGMNCSFEDCMVLEQCMDQHPGNWQKIFTAYQEERKKDADAIGDLAEENFYEMRDHVANEDYRKKRVLEMQLEQTYPQYYSKYSMVTFQDQIPYSVAREKGNRQDAFLLDLCRRTADIGDIDLESLLQDIGQL